MSCPCGDDDPAGCVLVAVGYPWCAPCQDHHRAPDCAIDQDGRPLKPCGHPWEPDRCACWED